MTSREYPTTDPRSEYDHIGGEIHRPELVEDLRDRIEGDVRFDEYSRQLYATDASAYEVIPVGVVFPASTDDVASVMTYCAEQNVPVLPRGGGTSLAGQAVNDAVVLDFTVHMDDLLDIDPDTQTAHVQAGAVLEDLNTALKPYGLKFAPDPAAGDRSTIGGAIGNNSTGAHSLKYGKTDAYVEEVEVVLADGTVTTFGEVSLPELRDRAAPNGSREAQIYEALRRVIDEEAAQIRETFPQLKRNVSGYNLNRIIAEADDGTINAARIFAGSEGTLGIITEATIALEPIPETKAVALLAYREPLNAMADVDTIVSEHDPAAVEAIDDVLLDLARETDEFADLAAMLPDETETALLVEFYAESSDHGRRQVAELIDDRVEGEAAKSSSVNSERAFAALEAHDADERAKLWKLRKSGLPILMSRTTDAKHISFIEDTAVSTEDLADFVADFQVVLEEHNTFASFYAHAGAGCMHIRPLVNTKSPAGIEQMESIADAVTDLVVEYDGSVSGEHGDGRARTQWNRKLYGDEVWNLFRELKTAFDPDWLLNPGQVCGDVSMIENLRFSPDYDFEAGFESALEWGNPNRMQGMVELCHGCGGCRADQESAGGVMCPTYRAANEEALSTRGRANMLRQAMSGDLPANPTDDEFMTEVMDLCIGCKGCARDCPSEVDMAKLKAEVEHAHHQEHGADLRDRLFANIHQLNAIGSALTPLSNWATRLPGTDRLIERLVGIARERNLPIFASESLEDWFDTRGGSTIAPDAATRRAVLVPDPYTNYNHPMVGKAAVRVLEAADVHVDLADIDATGRPAFSKGFLDAARKRATKTVETLAPRARDGWDIVLVEPSDAVMLQSDYLDLLSGNRVDTVSSNAYGICEYLDRFRLDEELNLGAEGSLTYHGHCHQKATKKDHHAVGVLRRAGYTVDPLDSGCCGMAGSFGYEAEHYAISKAIAEILYEQVEESDGDEVVAPGASCRTQLADYVDAEPPHPIEKLADAL